MGDDMKIAGEEFKVSEYFYFNSSVPDCIVTGPNKIGGGHGEAKFYISSKDSMRDFYGGEGFNAKVIMLKSDLIAYMNSIKNEYFNPTYPYGVKYNSNRKIVVPLSQLWKERYDKVLKQSDIITFYIQDQTQIEGNRGYVNSEDFGYKLIREIALPESSFISSCKLVNNKGNCIYYWKLFVDYVRLLNSDYVPQSISYGTGSKSSVPIKPEVDKKIKDKKVEIEIEKQKARNGQGKYREELLNEMVFCPITKIADERLLIASHIKPWAVSEDLEKIDHNNGYILSPMFDKLFDRGFITFTEDRRIHLSEKISKRTYDIIGIKENQFFQDLPMNAERLKYLDYHRKNVFADFARFNSVD